MVEMNETSNIVNNATDHSLIILDEIAAEHRPSTASPLLGVLRVLHDKIKRGHLFRRTTRS